MEGSTRRCPRCGAALTHGEAALCPACMSENAGLGDDPMKTTILGADLFTAEDLAGLFPEVRIDQLIERREEVLVYRARLADTDDNVWLRVAPCLDIEEAVAESCLRSLDRLRALKHPGIAEILLSGERDGCLYAVTRFVEGRPLSELIRSKELASPDALDLVHQLVGAIQEVKKAGVGSASVRVEDVVVTASGAAVIVDPGIERMLRVSAAPEDEESKDTTAGDSRDATSLGALFYELLTGDPLPDTRGRRTRPGDGGAVGLLEDRVDGYQLIEKIGEGGFGIVYLAEQTHPVKRKVALKILKPGMDSAEIISRFEAERQALALLDDPNTAAIYDAGETERGRPFFAMELVDGVPINAFCKTHQLNCHRRIGLFLQVCNAIRHAHQRGIIHRDLKPSNILVQEDDDAGLDGQGKVKVIDFGIAKATEAVLSEATLHTRAAQILGTPDYMSPEQARMEPGVVDTRSDVYALGAILYELLTGVTPFHRSTGDEKTPLDEVLRMIREDDPAPPSQRLRNRSHHGVAHADVQGDLDWIALKALQKEPSARYHSVQELAADLNRFLSDDAIAARPPSLSYSARKFARRHRTLVATVAVGLATLLAGTIVSTKLFFEARHSEHQRKETFSRSDFLGSHRLIDSGDPRRAVAQLVRSIRTDPENKAACFKLMHTLATNNFIQPVASMEQMGSSIEIRFSRDGRLIGTVTKDGYVHIWDGMTCEERHRIPLPYGLEHCDFDPAGRRFVVTGFSPEVTLWDTETGERVWRHAFDQDEWANEVRFSPDGTRILVTGRKGNVLVLDPGSGDRIHEMRHDEDYAWRAGFSPDGAHMITGGGPGVYVWNAVTGEPVLQYKHGSGKRVWWVTFSPDSRWVASANGKTVQVRSLDTGELAVPELLHPSLVERVVFSPDGGRLATGTDSPDSRVRIWNAISGARIGRDMPMENDILALAFSGDGMRIFAGALVNRGERALCIFDADSGELLSAPVALPRGVQWLALDPTETRLVTTSREFKAHLWDIRPRASHPMELKAPGSVWFTTFTRDGRSVGALARGPRASLWDVETGEIDGRLSEDGKYALVASGNGGSHLARGQSYHKTTMGNVPTRERLKPPEQAGGARHLAVARDGATLAVGGLDGHLRVWNLPERTPRFDPFDVHSSIRVLAFSQDDSRIHVGTTGGLYVALDAATGAVLRQIESAEPASRMTSAYDDGKHTLGLGYANGLFRLIDVETGEEHHLQHHREAVVGIEFFNGGTHVVTASLDNTATVWETASGKLVSKFTDHIDKPTFWGFWMVMPTPDTIVTAGSYDATMRTWDWRTGKAVSPPMQSVTAPFAIALDRHRGFIGRGGDQDRVASIWDPATGQPLTGDLPASQRVVTVAYSDDGRRFAAGDYAGYVRVYDMPPTDDLPAWFLDFAEAYVGLRYDDAGLPRVVGAERLAALRARILARHSSDDLTQWAQWLAAEPASERSISPWSRRTRREAADWLVGTGRLSDVEQALRLVPDHREALAALSQALFKKADPSESDRMRARHYVLRSLSK